MKMPEKINNANIFGRTFSRPRVRERIFVSMVTLALAFATWPLGAFQDAQGATQARQALPHAQQTLCIRIRWWRRSWRRPRFPSKSSKPTDGCKSILI